MMSIACTYVRMYMNEICWNVKKFFFVAADAAAAATFSMPKAAY